MKNRENDGRVVRRSLVEPGSLVAAVDAWQRSPEWQRLRPGTQRNYVLYLRPLHEEFKAVQMGAIERNHLLQIRNDIASERGHGAALTFCRAVGAFFTWARRNDLINISPAIDLAYALQRGSHPAWREDQAQQAMRELPEPYRRAVVLAYHTGQRRGDLCRLRWSDYDGRVIRLTQEKTLEPVELPVWRVPQFQAELETWKTDRQTVTILEYHGRPWVPNYLSTWLPDRLERIGLPRELGLHGLRRLTAIRLAEHGCSIHEIAAITGHRSLQMVQEYTRGVRQRSLADVAYLRLAPK